MLRRFAILCALWLVSLGRPAMACKCLSSLQPCNQTSASDVVFIGTVESMEPVFLSRWNPFSQASMGSLNQAYIDAREHPSDASIARLKSAYRTAFPDFAADQQSRLQSAKTAARGGIPVLRGVRPRNAGAVQGENASQAPGRRR